MSKGRLPATDNQGARAFIDGERGLHAETVQSALTVVLKLVVRWSNQRHLGFFLIFLIFCWSIVDFLLCCASFRCATQCCSYTYIYSFSDSSLILQNIDYSFLCSMVGPCWLFFFNNVFLFYFLKI